MNQTTKQIHCCQCDTTVEATLTYGIHQYPHRTDLHSLPFWECPACSNFVGCHYKSNDPLQPLGTIPSPEIKAQRRAIHALLDPIWQSGKLTRRQVYKHLSKCIGTEYHTANIRNLKQAQEIIEIIKELKDILDA